MWLELYSTDFRLKSAVAESLVKNSELLRLYNEGKKEECYQKLMRSIDKQVDYFVKERVETEHKLRLLGLLPDQLTNTFVKWIKDNVKNPLPRDIRKHEDVVVEVFMKILEDTIEAEIPLNLLFEFWGVYQDSQEPVPFETDVEDMIRYFFQQREDEISKKL